MHLDDAQIELFPGLCITPFGIILPAWSPLPSPSLKLLGTNIIPIMFEIFQAGPCNRGPMMSGGGSFLAFVHYIGVEISLANDRESASHS